MAWALLFDGVNDQAQFSAIDFTSTQEFSIRATFEVDSGAIGVNSIIDRSNSYYFAYDVTAEEFLWVCNSNTTSFSVPASFVLGSQLTVHLKQTSLGVKTIEVDGFGTSAPNAALNDYTMIRFGRASSRRFLGQLLRVELFTDTAETNKVNDWDATASVPGGVPPIGTPVLIDTVSANDATGVNMPTDGSAWVDLGGGQIDVTVTEVLNSFEDTVSSSISINVSSSVTETLSAFNDLSQITITEAGQVSATITETLNAFEDNSIADISANIGAIVTESLNSFSDSVNAIIQKEVEAQVTEQLNAFSDSATIRLPINITINPKNVVRVARKQKTTRVLRRQKTVRVR